MANTVSEILKCCLLRSQPLILAGDHWEPAVAHSPFLILAYLSVCLRRVRFGQWILSIDSSIATAFIYCSIYNPEDNLTPALLQIGICMQFGFCQEMYSTDILMCAEMHAQVCSLTAGLFVTVKSWKRYKCPSIDCGTSIQRNNWPLLTSIR